MPGSKSDSESISRSWEVASEVVQVLVPWVAEKKRPITYSTLSEKILDLFGDIVNAHTGFNYPLGIIQQKCKEQGLPNISVMVVTKETGTPSDGWYLEHDRLYPELSGLENYEKRMMASDAAIACQNWGKLYESFGIQMIAPIPQIGEKERARVYFEGARTESYRVREELKRSGLARQDCLRFKGSKCFICDFDSKERYGVEGIIHVHHLHPLANGEERETNPETDLIPVCPNCHAIIHSKPSGGIYSPEEVREMLRESQIAFE